MLDAGFLHAEDSDRHVSLAIGALSVLAGPMPDFDPLAAGLAERILSVPRFRQVLRTQPLDLGGGSPRSWSAASIETVRCGNAGSSTAFSTTGGRS
jgi:diacylglycerol O-acyltransferase